MVGCSVRPAHRNTVEHPTLSSYQYDSRTGTVTGKLDGFHVESFPNLGSSKGVPLVTAYGGSPAVCDTHSWFPDGVTPTTEQAAVGCNDTSGVQQDATRFDVVWLQGLGLKGINLSHVAYLLADRETRTTTYTPSADTRYVSAGAAPRVKRNGLGRYTVTLPGMPAGGSVQVSLSWKFADVCVISSISLTAPQKVGVRCFALPSGHRADVDFTLAYAK